MIFKIFLVCFSLTVTAHSFVLQDPTPPDDTPALHSQDDHATDEEKLASSTSHKWAALHDMDADLNSDQQEFPQPCDLTSFVNENSLPHQDLGEPFLSNSLRSLFVSPATCFQTYANRDQSIPQPGSAERKFKAYVWIKPHVQQSATLLFIHLPTLLICLIACWPSSLLPSDL